MLRVARCQKLQMTFNPVWHRMLYSCTYMATVGVKGLIDALEHYWQLLDKTVSLTET